MPERSYPIVLNFNGGYATDLPSQSRELNYFLKAENIIYEVSGAVRKLGGRTELNSVAMNDDVVGLFDYWRAGTAGSFTQQFVAVTASGAVYKEDMDGTFDNITGSSVIGNDVVPVFCVMRDLLTIWFSDGSVPVKYNTLANCTALGGSPPAGRGAVFHVNRGWAWGKQTTPSTLYYSSSTSVEDWTGTDTGSFEIDPDDGDVIVGAVSFKGKLIVFKGPNKGSIHIISGTAPTGSDAFTRTLMVKGTPLQSPNAIVPVGDDILFMSDRGIHSLSATQAYGDLTVADLTRFLKRHFRENVSRTGLNKVWALDYSDKSSVLFTVPGAGSSVNDSTIGLSYVRFAEEGWKPFTWTRGGLSAAIRINPTTKIRELCYGGLAGVVYKEDQRERSLPNNTSYAMRLRTPELVLGKQDGAGTPRGDQPFVVERMYLRSVSTGDWDVTVAVSRDNKPAQLYTFNQGHAGFILGESLLGAGTLGGAKMQISYADERDNPIGEARAIQFEISQNGVQEDANILELGIEIKPTAQSNLTEL